MTAQVTAFSPIEQWQQQWVRHQLSQVMAVAVVTQRQPDWGMVLQILRDRWLEQKGEAQ